MFACPVFSEVIHPFTLRFKCEKLEADYIKSVEENYLRSRWVPRIIFASLAAAALAWVGLSIHNFLTGKLRNGTGVLMTACLVFIGILAEIAISWKLKIAKTVPLILFVLIATAVLNTSTLNNPSWRPGYYLFNKKGINPLTIELYQH